MKRASLQGTPWHYQQMQKTCKTESKYCIYNFNICSCKHSRNYHKKCVGKGQCDDFESKNGTPKVYEQKSYKVNKIINEGDKILKEQQCKSTINQNNKPILNEKHEKFRELAEKRVDAIIDKIETLENLADKNRYEYTPEEVEKMFNFIEKELKSAKESFIKKNKTRFKF